jgi:osmotically-inducible protein OsmY
MGADSTDRSPLAVLAGGFHRREGTMKSRMLGALAIAITSTIGVVGVAAANDADDRVEDRIESRLSHDAKLKGHDVRVDVENGVATLKGKVPDQAHRARAERLAHVAGVTRIDNNLEIDKDAVKDRIEDNARMAKKRIDDRAEKAKDQVDAREDRAKARVDAQAKTAKEQRDVDRSVDVDRDRRDDRRADVDRRAPVERRDVDRKPENENEVTDAWITTKVKAQFIGVDALKGSDISVDTNQNGVVTLTGTVPNEVARAKAVEIARTTKGVRKVVDDMKPTRKY